MAPKHKLTLFKKSISDKKIAPPQTPAKTQCTDATLLQLKFCPESFGLPKGDDIYFFNLLIFFSFFEGDKKI